METLSSSVSTFRTSALPLPAFKPPSPSRSNYQQQQQPHLLPRHNSISNKQQQLLLQTHVIKLFPSTNAISSSATHHYLRRPSSGYAAALLDISLCNNSAERVAKEAVAYAKLMHSKPILELMRNPFIDGTEKKQVLKELTEKGKLEKHLTALLTMLIMKNKLAIINDVLEEFRQMYGELCRSASSFAHN